MTMTPARPTQSDLEQVFDLIIRSDIAEYGEPDSELSDLKHVWSQIDLDQDAWISMDPHGRIEAYAALVPSRGERRIDLVLQPEGVDLALAQDLLRFCIQRIQNLALSQEIRSHTFLAHLNHRDRELFQEAGFTYGKSFYQLHADLSGKLATPSWPKGVTVRTAETGDDDEAIYRTVQRAFEYGDDGPTFDQWREHMFRPEVYDPDLWFLVVAADELVGTCLGVKYEVEGWIRQFGVIPEWRGKGVATAMLQHAFLVFRDRGYERVGLGMEATNERALRLYERIGMKVRRQYDEYRKVVPARYNMDTSVK